MTKKIFLALALIVVLAMPVHSDGYMYISIFADHNHSECNKITTVAPDFFSAWVFVHGNTNGLTSAYFGITDQASAWIDYTGYSINPAAGISTHECPFEGIGKTFWCLSFDTCQDYEWLWLFSFQYVITAPSVGGMIAVDQDPDWLAYVDCSTTDHHPLTIYSNLMVNLPCTLSNDANTWGAIKALYSE